ncbi:transposase [Rhodococcus sp. SMB37]|nr:transposase [Rhodococcus sp. SMB37]
MTSAAPVNLCPVVADTRTSCGVSATESVSPVVAERVRVRELDDDEGMPVPKIAEVSFTSADRVRDVIHNFNNDGFDSLYPIYAGGRPRTFTPPERREIKKIAKSTPVEHDLPFSTWSLTELAEFLVAEGWSTTSATKVYACWLREEGVSFQEVETFQRSKDPDQEPQRRRRATYTRPHGVRHLFAAYDLGEDELFGHVTTTKNRTEFLEFCRYLRTLYPAEVRIAIVCDYFSPHLTTKKCQRVARWAEANNVEIAYTRRTVRGSTGSMRSSPRCGTSCSTVPITVVIGAVVDDSAVHNSASSPVDDYKFHPMCEPVTGSHCLPVGVFSGRAATDVMHFAAHAVLFGILVTDRAQRSSLRNLYHEW